MQIPAEAGTRAGTRLDELARLLADMDGDELKRGAKMMADELKRRRQSNE